MEQGISVKWLTTLVTYKFAKLRVVINPVIQHNACFSHPEHIWLCMLSEDLRHICELAMWRILGVRSEQHRAWIFSNPTADWFPLKPVGFLYFITFDPLQLCPYLSYSVLSHVLSIYGNCTYKIFSHTDTIWKHLTNIWPQKWSNGLKILKNLSDSRFSHFWPITTLSIFVLQYSFTWL